MTRTFAILGAGPAGATAAATLREEGFDGRVVLIGEEQRSPYERPPLSKEYLRGEYGVDDLWLRPAGWFEEQDIEFLSGTRATRLDVAGRGIELSSGERVGFDRALLATGSRNRPIDVPGRDLPGVLDLRRIADADRIRERVQAGARVAVVGMGFIGAEVAASLRQMGSGVEVVEPLETAMFRVLGPELGRVVETIHRDHGVRMRFGEAVDRFEGSRDVEALVTSSGRRVTCDFAVVGVGVQPNVELAEQAGLPAPNGIAVDAALRTASPDVFAAGDVALHDHPLFGPLRVEHHDNALKMGQAAARNMLGAPTPFDDPHWFWSDQYDVNIQVAGVAQSFDEVIIRGAIEDRSFSAFLLREGQLLSVVGVNRPRDVRRAMALIRAGARPDAASLRDETVDLRTLAPVAR